MQITSDSTYWNCSGKIFYILKSSLQQSLILVLIIILIILLRNLKMLLLYKEFPRNINL